MVFPTIYITATDTSTTNIFPRLAREPNTVFEDTFVTSAMYSNSVYVFEYYDPSNADSANSMDYNTAFTLKVDNGAAGGNPLVLDIPAYVPATTPALPISGYLSTNWSNPLQSGEGMVLQVYDNGDKATRTLSFAWFTYDDQNTPFWLYGQAAFNIGATTVTAQTVYLTGGTFAYSGNVVFPVPTTPWGSVTFTFPDCGHMNIAYDGDASAVHGPTGNSTAQFTRVADVANLGCQ